MRVRVRDAHTQMREWVREGRRDEEEEEEVTEVWLMDDKTILGFVERNGLLWNKRISSLSLPLVLFAPP